MQAMTASKATPRSINRVRRAKDELLEFLIQVKRDGKTIAGYGAPGKARRCSITAGYELTISTTL